jgi:hypothetical protein
MMTSRERVKLALEHQEADRVPLDVGATTVTGMHVTSVYLLRQALGLDPPGTPVKVMDPLLMLGEIKPDLMEALGIDVVKLGGRMTSFGYELSGWKEWRTFEGIPVLVPAGFNTAPEPDGDLLMYPCADCSAPPSARMPKGGFYFDTIIRQPPINEDHLRPEQNLEEFSVISDEEQEHFRREAERLYQDTDKAIVLSMGGLGFGDVGRVPGPGLKYPKGIRDLEEWYMNLSFRRDFIYKVFEAQMQIDLASLAKIHDAVGERVAAIYWTGADFGSQNGTIVSPRTYRDLFSPFHKQVNEWIHQHTSWKTFIHSCGSVWTLIDDFIAAGFDIFNPLQCSAANMDPCELKNKFGNRIAFWGGGVDTQQTLPFGTPDDVRKEVRERLQRFGSGGSFIFSAIHNIQALVPVANLLALFETVRDYGRYPL